MCVCVCEQARVWVRVFYACERAGERERERERERVREGVHPRHENIRKRPYPKKSLVRTLVRSYVTQKYINWIAECPTICRPYGNVVKYNGNSNKLANQG